MTVALLARPPPPALRLAKRILVIRHFSGLEKFFRDRRHGSSLAIANGTATSTPPDSTRPFGRKAAYRTLHIDSPEDKVARWQGTGMPLRLAFHIDSATRETARQQE